MSQLNVAGHGRMFWAMTRRNLWIVNVAGGAAFFALFLISTYMLEGRWDWATSLAVTAIFIPLCYFGERAIRSRRGDEAAMGSGRNRRENSN